MEGDYQLRNLQKSDLDFIRETRNAQVEILRYPSILTPENQEAYWEQYMADSTASHPLDYLYMQTYNDESVGYGGFIDIDWNKREAGLSYLTHPSRHDYTTYENDFTWFLNKLIELARFPLWDIKELTSVTYMVNRTSRPQAVHFGCMKRAGFKITHTELDRERNCMVYYQRNDLYQNPPERYPEMDGAS